ncbi:PREDICTED: LOW QUALITY PROTEIN: genetic suppressor element 1 [Aptenodytes forsteri]|uniref:LOW QUALITY PROTEIN: genetic suppressor element 1 n=1 Tax=Aptenodytes forsteri TaxID=9233 RepID=UPI00090463B5|nr:PREDICTED: LOW QUALITY PROTEIN: genetic suppressor element 1 [Aptenodytes forsteri]
MFGLKPPLYYLPGMSHEPKSPSLGMLSTATRTTATVSPLTPSPLNGSIVPNGSPAASSTLSVQAAPSSSFAAALRKLAKQAEEPRGSSISSESSPVSSPATNHSSPASTPKRGPMGPIIVPPGGHSVPSTPPVVTIAPTKTVNGVWRSEGRQVWPPFRPSGSSGGRERLISEPPLAQEKAGGPTVPSHLLGTPYTFGLPPLQRPVHHVVPPSAVTEDYLRSFRPYHTAEDLRMSSLPPLGLDPAAPAAYYHPSYLTHHPFPHPAFRMDGSYCLSALRSPFYPLPAPGSLPPLHPSARQAPPLHPSAQPELSHSSLSALQSERISSLAAERLQMDEELRQREREREREREKEREREADREREKEREREREREKELEREREKERERELERQRERAREKELSMVKAMEGPFLPVAELHGLRGHPAEERGKPVEPLVPGRPEELKDSVLPTPKPIQHPLPQPPASHHPVPSLIPNHNVFPLPGSSAATALLIHRTNEEEKWLARQRRLRQEKEDRQSQVSEFRQQVLEQHLGMGRAPSQPEPEHRPEHPRGLAQLIEDNKEQIAGRHKGECPPQAPFPVCYSRPKPERREQALKLDTSSEKLEFLQLFGLTTQQQKEELLSQKRRKRRRMLRERSPSPPTVQNKRRTPSPRLPLSTRYSPDEMNNSPNFEEKKRFLTIFNLTHISAEKRKDKEKLVEMLQAMKQKSPAWGQLPVPPLLLDPDKPVGIVISVPEAQKTAEPGRLDQLRPQELPRAKESAATLAEKPRLSDGHPGKKALSILSYVRGPLPKDIPVPLSHSMNGKSKPWEPFIAEEFAHQFHESVLQSTQKALQKHKEQNLERQVLQTQCRRLEAQHYSLSLTAEQLSHSMA